MKRFNCWLSLGLVLTLGFLLGILGFSIWEKIPTSVERVVWSPDAQWIGSPSPTYRFYARHTFNLPDTVKAGWVRLSADNDFTFYVNGQQVAIENSALNSSVGLAGGIKIPSSQDFNDSNSYLFQNTSYLVASSRDWKLTTYVDLTSYLRPGKNVIGLEIQKGQTNPRVVVEGAVYPVADATPINLTTGATAWQISNLSESKRSLQWFDPDFSDVSWSEAKVLGSVTEATYSRLSQNLFERSLQGSWIGGTQSSKRQVWLRGVWQIPSNPISRAYIRFAGNSNYSLLLNGALVNQYKAEDSNQLHLLEVTKLLHPGDNFLAVSLANSLDPALAGSTPVNLQDSSGSLSNSLDPTLAGSTFVNSHGSVNFFLDGWANTDKGEIIGAIATGRTWTSLTETVPGWAEGAGEDQPVTLLGLPQTQQFQRSFEGNAYLLNYPNYLWYQSIWQLGGIAFALVYASILGFWLGRQGSWWDRLSVGAAILSPGTLFLIGIGLLKHRYAEAEIGLLFAQPQSNYLILLGFTGIVVLTLLLTSLQQNIKRFPQWCLWFVLGLVACASLSLVVGGNVAVVTGIVASTFAWIQGRRHKQTLLLYHVRLMTYYMNPHPALWAPLSQAWERGRGRGLDIVTVYTDMILQDVLTALQRKWSNWGEWVFLILIVSVGFGLRVYYLDFMDLDTDENTSLDATRGILRTGFPLATSGIWYTRGPFYHYLLALWLRLVGDSIVNARLLSALWGTATLVLVYIFARQLTGKVWISLLVTAVLAIDPWHIWYSRFIRFYPVLQFLTILCFWSFFNGFINKAGRRYQYIFFIALTLSLLTQEINLTLLPVFLIGFLYFYRPFNLLNDWQIVLGSMMTLVIFIYDLGVAVIRLLSPLPALSDATASYLRLHFHDVTSLFAPFFIGSDRAITIYAFLFFAGFIYFLKQRNGKIIFLFVSIFINLLLVTILAYYLAARYVYGVYPLFILLSIYSGICITESLGKKMQSVLDDLLPLRAIALSCILLLLICNIQPGRVLAGYQEAILRRNTELFEYIRTHRQSGDVVLSSVPSFAPISFGKLDYYLFTPLQDENFDATYWHDSRLIDRWGGGVIVNNVEQLNRILEKSQRVWLHVDDVRHPRITLELRQYVQILGKPAFETFGTRLRLWQPENGLPSRIHNQGKDLGAY